MPSEHDENFAPADATITWISTGEKEGDDRALSLELELQGNGGAKYTLTYKLGEKDGTILDPDYQLWGNYKDSFFIGNQEYMQRKPTGTGQQSVYSFIDDGNTLTLTPGLKELYPGDTEGEPFTFKTFTKK